MSAFMAMHDDALWLAAHDGLRVIGLRALAAAVLATPATVAGASDPADGGPAAA